MRWIASPGYVIYFGIFSPCDTLFSNKYCFRLFRSERNAEKIGDCTFLVQERLQPAPGQMLMLAKSNKCNARFAALLTPKWLLLGLYNFSASTEGSTLAILDELRKEAFSSPAVPQPPIGETAEGSAPTTAAAALQTETEASVSP